MSSAPQRATTPAPTPTAPGAITGHGSSDGWLSGDGTGWLLRPLGWLLGIPHRGLRSVELIRTPIDTQQERWQRRIDRRRWATRVTIDAHGFVEQPVPGLQLHFARVGEHNAVLTAIAVGGLTSRSPVAIEIEDHPTGGVTVTLSRGRHRCRYHTQLSEPKIGRIWQ